MDDAKLIGTRVDVPRNVHRPFCSGSLIDSVDSVGWMFADVVAEYIEVDGSELSLVESYGVVAHGSINKSKSLRQYHCSSRYMEVHVSRFGTILR